MRLQVGIDDTDSTRGGCTTYIAARLVEKISKMDAQFIDYPNIIRLNPNIPFKTRGNAAVALRLEVAEGSLHPIHETVLEEIESSSHIGQEGTEPAVVFLTGKPGSRIKEFSRQALYRVMPYRDAVKTIKATGAEAAVYGSELGLVGALAAVGQTLNEDHTFELVAYRARKNWGTPRRVDVKSVERMDTLTAPKTFNNYDAENKRTLVTPHGPDPVLLGIRGENPKTLLRAFQMLIIREPVERWVIFRTNHGTDAHLQQTPLNRALGPYTPAILKGTVFDRPRQIRGGHVFFTLKYRSGMVRCAAFEPTGAFRQIIASLLPGDQVTVYGGVRKHDGELTVNLEKIHLDRLIDNLALENPICPNCGKHMKSAGRGQGFRCERCSFAAPRAKKQRVKKERGLHRGLYIPALKAHRHLTKPTIRYGQEKLRWDGNPPYGTWHEP